MEEEDGFDLGISDGDWDDYIEPHPDDWSSYKNELDEVVFLVRICLENGEEQTLIPYQVMPTRGFGIGVLNLQFLCIRPENLMH